MNAKAKQKAGTILCCKMGKIYCASYLNPTRALSTKAVVLKLWRASESPGELVKNHILGPQLPRFCISESGVGP